MGLFLELMEPMAAGLACGIRASLPGVVEGAPGLLKQVLWTRIKEHFRSTKDVAKALELAMDTALRAMEVALARPWLLTRTERKEFAASFEAEFLLPLAQEKGWSAEALEPFRKKAARGCKTVRSGWRDWLEMQAATEENLAHALAGAAVASDAASGLAAVFERLLERLAQPDALGGGHPLLEVMAYRQALRGAVLWEFDQQVKHNPELARYLEMISLRRIEAELGGVAEKLSGVDRGLEELKTQIKRATDEDQDELLEQLQPQRKGLRRQKEELEGIKRGQIDLRERVNSLGRMLEDMARLTKAAAGWMPQIAGQLDALHGLAEQALERLDAVREEVRETRTAVESGVSEIKSLLADRVVAVAELEELVGRVMHRVMAAVAVERQVKPRDSFVSHSSRDLDELRRAVEDLHALQVQSKGGSSRTKLLLDAGAALNSAQRAREAVAMFRQAAEVGTVEERSLAYSNIYVTEVGQDRLDEALAALRQAWELDPVRYMPFDVHQYEPERILGAGGMGVAFLCRRFPGGDRVVVKTFWEMDTSLPKDELFREALLMQQVESEHIVRPIAAAFADPLRRERPYIMMEYFEAEDGERLLSRLGGPLTLQQSIEVCRQLAGALVAAHAKGVCHLDLKPANLLIRLDGDKIRVKVIDFGLARSVKPLGRDEALKSSASSKSVLAQRVFGTLDYAPPEQLGERPEPPGPYSDVYAFGATLARLLTAKSPRRVRERDLPAEIKNFWAWCTEEVPSKRPSTEGLSSFLSEFRQGHLVVSTAGDALFLSISDALAEAPVGAQIFVKPGIYRESLVLKKPVQLIAQGLAGQVILESSDGSCILMQTETATVQGFTLRCLAGERAPRCRGADVPSGHLTLKDCDITSNSGAGVLVHGNQAQATILRSKVHDGASSGIAFDEGAQGLVEDCDIFGNENAGISIVEGGNPQVKGCKIHDGKGFGVIVSKNGQGIIENCSISNNTYAGIIINHEGNPKIKNCNIHDMKQSGVYVLNNGQGTIENCDIFGNEDDGVLISEGGNLQVKGCKIHDGKQAGVYVHDHGQGIIENCDIYSNTRAGVAIQSNGNPVVRNCRVNRNGYEAVWVFEKGAGTVEYCDLTGNGKKGSWDIEEGCVVQRSNNKEDQGTNFKFSGQCPSCHKITGFFMGSTTDFLASMALGTINPFSSVISIFKKNKIWGLRGSCQNCNKICCQCPKCKEIFPWKENFRLSVDMKCTDCGYLFYV